MQSRPENVTSVSHETGARQRQLELFLAQKGKCFFCDKELDSICHPKSKRGYTVDHLYPKSKGGSLLRNKVFSCIDCNKNKGNRTPTKEETKKYNKIVERIKRRRKLLKD